MSVSDSFIDIVNDYIDRFGTEPVLERLMRAGLHSNDLLDILGFDEYTWFSLNNELNIFDDHYLHDNYHIAMMWLSVVNR